MRMRWTFYGAAFLIFLLGTVTGVLLGITSERDRLRRLEKEGQGPVLEEMITRLEKELKLTPVQVSGIRAVYSSTRPKLRQLELERRHRLLALMRNAHPAIMEILNPEQRDAFNRLQEKLNERLGLGESAIPESPGGTPEAPPVPPAPRPEPPPE